MPPIGAENSVTRKSAQRKPTSPQSEWSRRWFARLLSDVIVFDVILIDAAHNTTAVHVNLGDCPQRIVRRRGCDFDHHKAVVAGADELANLQVTYGSQPGA